MKNIKKILIIVAIILAGGSLYSCSKDDGSASNQPLDKITLKSAVNCEQCVSNWIDSKEIYNAFVKHTGNSKKPTITPFSDMFLDVYNDDSKLYYKAYRFHGTFGNIKINNSGTIGFSPAVTQYSWSVNLPENWTKCDVLPISLEIGGVSGGGGKLVGSYNYSLRELCPACEDNFTYTTTNNLNVLFSYVSCVSLTGAEIQFTCPNIRNYISIDGKTYSISHNGNITILTYHGNIEAGVPISFALSFIPDCNQNESGFANIWTDFSVNGISKKGSLSDIQYICY